MSRPTPDAEVQFTSALRQLVQAQEHAVLAIRMYADAQQAFMAATRLETALRAAGETVADLRGVLSVRILDEDRLSLAALADRISTSKARADQLVRRGRRTLDGEAREGDDD